MFTWTDAYWISLAILSGMVGSFILLFVVPLLKYKLFKIKDPRFPWKGLGGR